MTTTERRAAEERLLDAELETLFGRTAATAPRPPRARPWAMAAGLLLGIGVAVGTWWLQRGDAATAARPQDPVRQQQQEPAPLPPPEYADSPALVADLPDDTANLVASLDAPADFGLLQRFAPLRRLALIARDPGRGLGALGKLLTPHREWTMPPAAALAPLATLSRLESLQLPWRMAVRGEHLLALRTAPALRHLALGSVVRIDEALVAALAQLPHLRELDLLGCTVDAEVLRRVAALPLDELRLVTCPGVDAESLAALAGSKSLRALRLDGIGKPAIDATPAAAAAVPPIDATWLAPLAELSTLRELSLNRCLTAPGALARLPERLEGLDLYSSSGFTLDDLRALRRLGSLRRLSIRERTGYGIAENHALPPREAADALADALAALRLTSLQFTGVASPALLQTLAEQPDLARLELVAVFGENPIATADGLQVLARSRSLVELKLRGLSWLDDAALAQLAACPTLRRVDVSSCQRATQAGAAAALPGVTVTVVTLEQLLRTR